jgi:hypothetical protein
MQLEPNPIHSSNFLFSKDTFIAEASDLQNKFALGRVYDDACDEGFTIISAKTGKEAVFALAMVKSDGIDLLSWNFVCVTPSLEHLKAVIFND